MDVSPNLRMLLTKGKIELVKQWSRDIQWPICQLGRYLAS